MRDIDINEQTLLIQKQKKSSFIQLILFLLVGTSGTILTLSLIFLLTEFFRIFYLISVIIGYFAGICNNYYWNRKYTFQSDSPDIILEYSNYLVVTVIGGIIYFSSTLLLTEFYKIWYFYSSIISVGTTATVDFLFSKFWVFRSRSKYGFEISAFRQINTVFSKDLTVIIPVYNEETIIRDTIGKTLTYLSSTNLGYEIIIADDGSTDNTVQNVTKEFGRNSHIKISSFQENKGHGFALRSALNQASGKYVIYMDADLASDLKHIMDMVHYLEEGYVIVTGSRLSKGSVVSRERFRLYLSRSYNIWIRLLFQDRVNDHQCGFKGFRKDILLYILDDISSQGWFWDTEVLLLGDYLGLPIREFPIIWEEKREKGQSKVKIFNTISNFLRESISFKLKLIIYRKRYLFLKKRIKSGVLQSNIHSLNTEV